MFDPSVVNRMLRATRLETTFISRLSAATHGSATAIPAVRAAIQAYHASESGARDLIDTLFTILGQELDTNAAFIPSLANIVANDEKRADLLATWNKFKHEQEQQFPSLPSSLPTSQTGSRNKRAVQVKKLQANHTQRRVWDLVAQAASSSQPVQQTNSFSTPSSISSTPWSRSGAASMLTTVDHTNVSRPTPSISAFPSLPPSTVSRAPKEFVTGQSSLRAIVGTPVTMNAWTTASGPSTPQEAEDAEGTVHPNKKKKNTKQTLFTLGSLR